MKINRLVLNNITKIRAPFSDTTLTQKATLNAAAAALEFGARLLVGLLITPFMVAGLGSFAFGVWQFLLRMMGYITPATGRPTQALKMTLANQQQSTDYELKRAYVGSTLLVWLLFLPVLSALGGVLTWFTPYWIKAPAETIWLVRTAAGILVLNMIFTTLAALPQAALEGENLGYKRMGLSTLLILAGGGITWVFLYFQTGLWGIACSTLIQTGISGAFYLSVVRKYIPWFGVAKPSLAMARQFIGLSWWFLGWNLVMNLMTASDVIILGILLSAETVTSYTLSKYAPETAISLVAIVVFGISPGLGGIIGSGDFDKARKIRGEIMSLTWLVLTIFGACILLWNFSFIRLWVGAEHFAGAIPNLLILGVVYQFTFIRNDSNIIDLTLRLNQKVLIGLLSVIISICTAVVLIEYFNLGIVGLCLGIIAGRMVLSIGYPLLVGRFLTIPWLSQCKSLVRPAFATIFLFLLASLANANPAIESWGGRTGWVGLVFSSGLTLVGFSILAFYLGLNNVQRKKIFKRLRAIAATNSG